MEPNETDPLLPSSDSLRLKVPISLDDDCSSESSTSDVQYVKKHSQTLPRKPFHYTGVNRARTRREAGDTAIATYHRYRYYNRLADPSIDTLSIPDHVVPADFFFPFAALIKSPKKQSSVVTIFSIWNTMMGTSLLSIPWAIQQAGFACGMTVMFIMGTLCFYTAYRIVSLRYVGDVPDSAIEFPDLCKYLLGRWAEWLTTFFSLIPLIGGAVVYWVLMSNFLYFTGIYIYESVNHDLNITTDNSTYADVYCPSEIPIHHNNSLYLESNAVISNIKPSFYKFWDMESSIPFYMAVCLAPVISLKSPTFFTKFNALGTLSVIYLIAFIIAKGAKWGIHFNTDDIKSPDFVKLFQPTFPVLTGILCLAFFIHNCVLSIMRNQRHPEKNTRDLAIAYVLVAFTYLIIGVVFFITFPYSKDCIEDNLLNNFRSNDIFAVVTRIFLLFQVLTLYPLIVYLLRVQIMHFIFGSIYPGLFHVLVLNGIVLVVCILFAIYLPKVGTIIRFCGAFSGLVYVFTMPCIAYMKAIKNKGGLTISSVIFHSSIMILGLCIFFSQFFVNEFKKI